MRRRSDDKSAPEVYCKREDERNPSALDGQIGPLAPGEAPESFVDGTATQGTSATTTKSTRQLTPRGAAHHHIPPRRLAFCGGGMRGIAHVGVLKAMNEAGFLVCVKEVIGISAGALFALAFAIGYSVSELEKLALEFDFSLLRNIDPETAFLFPLTFGLDSGDMLQRFIASLLRQKQLPDTLTFRELASRSSLHFRCFATDLHTSKVREFSLKQTPDVRIVFALRASMSLPILYTPVKDPIRGTLLMDGAVLHNLPLVFLRPEEIEGTLAIFFTNHSAARQMTEPENPFQFFQYVYDSIIMMKNRPYIHKYKENILLVPTDGFNGLHFEETRENRARLIQSAYNTTHAFLLKPPTRTPVRRYSCS